VPRSLRAVIFDLDDTLYPLERFVLSGFDAVASHLANLFGVDRTEAWTTLLQAFHNGGRGRELQICLKRFGLPEAIAPSLVQVIRRHQPALALPVASQQMLSALSEGWRIGVVTNGVPEIQARKVAALGLAGRVHTVVYADAVGGGGKPDPAPFLEASRRLKVGVNRAVFVGNDPVNDVYGAWRVGMRTIHVAGTSPVSSSALVADAMVRSLSEVPEVAARLVA
jgi:putative hydrolase of the HAD superfamily